MPILALLIWPLAALALSRIGTRESALIWTLLTGYLFLPERFDIDLPGMPPINKYSIITITLGLVALVTNRVAGPRIGTNLHGETNTSPILQKIIAALILILFLSPILTRANNRNALIFGPAILPGMQAYDFVSFTWDTIITILPFLIARKYLSGHDAHRMFLKAIVIAALFYSLLMLIEIRLSPQLHNWIYGYHQHSFLQHVRGGDFRPKVFLKHGLWVGFFMFSAIIASFSLARNPYGDSPSVGWYLSGLWLLIVLFLSSNLGATLLAIIFIPFLFLGSSFRSSLLIFCTVAFMSYPLLRSTDAVPVYTFSQAIERISEERAASFQFRLEQEEDLLARANEKPVAGWGTWGRNRIYDDFGRDVSVTDGHWIVTYGQGGWLRYIAFFGLIAAPLISMGFFVKRKDVPIETISIALILVANLIYLIPNSTLSPIAWVMAGALAGFIQHEQMERNPQPMKTDGPLAPRHQPHKKRYSRFPIQPAAPRQTRR